jgi:hypothetical protein
MFLPRQKGRTAAKSLALGFRGGIGNTVVLLPYRQLEGQETTCSERVRRGLDHKRDSNIQILGSRLVGVGSGIKQPVE